MCRSLESSPRHLTSSPRQNRGTVDRGTSFKRAALSRHIVLDQENVDKENVGVNTDFPFIVSPIGTQGRKKNFPKKIFG